MKRASYVFNGLLVALFATTLVFGLPYVASVLYLYQGHLHLEQAVEGLGLDPTAWDIEAALAAPAPPSGEVARNLGQAVANLQNAMWWDARNKEVYRPLIQAYLLQRDYPAALNAALTLTQTAPEDRSLFVALGNIHARSGNMAQAIDTWKRAGARLAPDRQAEWQVGARLHLPLADFLPSQQGGAVAQSVGQTNLVMFLIDDTVERPLFFPEAGLYTVRLRAQHGQPPPIQLEIRQDGKTAGLLAYGNGDNSWGTQEAAFPVAFGLHWIGVRFANDYNAPPLDRNAVVEWIEISPAR